MKTSKKRKPLSLIRTSSKVVIMMKKRKRRKRNSGVELKESEDYQKKETMKLAKSSMSNEENLFNSICVGNLKEKIDQTKVNFFQNDTVDVYISGPFHKTGKSH